MRKGGVKTVIGMEEQSKKGANQELRQSPRFRDERHAIELQDLRRLGF